MDNLRLLIEFVWIGLNFLGVEASLIILRYELRKAREPREKPQAETPEIATLLAEAQEILAYEKVPLYVGVLVLQLVFALWGLYVMFFSTQTAVTQGFLIVSMIVMGIPIMFDLILWKVIVDRDRITTKAVQIDQLKKAISR